ncbi:sulfite exporter TauE/SafE family protein [Amaricoccus sp.]|uniref:sulfite exporter TauE/SafE family protein n=1 Tax=Amaricoccus sp. TaxID=1872485 RepID=UPI001B4DDDD5|nr:sulfite exporter TauE/SafE family protein [Amaricoccus sp.]
MDGLDAGTLATLVAALLAAGAVVGVLAGLFGVGGGAISVPVFFEIFGMLGYPEAVRMPLAVGTSLAVIIPTAIVSARGHYLRGTVDVGLLKLWAVPVVLGVAAGSLVARYANPDLFKLVFIAVSAVIAARLLSGGRGWKLRDGLPGRAALRVYGVVIGLLGSLMGVGGGAMSNLVLTLHGVPIHNAVSTSAGVGILISIPGALGYMAAGWGKPGLPPDAIGYVSLLAFLVTIPTSMLTTRLGVRLAHALSRRALEVAFGLFLLAVCARFVAAMIW